VKTSNALNVLIGREETLKVATIIIVTTLKKLLLPFMVSWAHASQPSQTASRSVQPFCRAHERDHKTDTQNTNRPRYSVCSKSRIWLLLRNSNSWLAGGMAQRYNVGLWPANFRCPALDL